MAEKNGKMFKIIMYLVGVLVIILMSVIGFIGKGVIANDQDSRSRDITQDRNFNQHIQLAQKTFSKYTMTQEKHNGKIQGDIQEMKAHNSQMKDNIKDIKATLNYIKNNGN